MSQSKTDDKKMIDWWSMIMDPGFIENPYPQLLELQKGGPIQYDTRSDMYFALGHKAFSEIMKSPDLGRDTHHWKNGWNTLEYEQRDPVGFELLTGNQPQMINCDGDDHLRMRKVYAPAFRNQMMSDLVPMIREETNRLIKAFPRGEAFDFMEKFAGPLPLRILCNLFDIPSAMDDKIAHWSAAIIRLADVMLTDDQKKDALESQIAFKNDLRDQLAQGQGKPDDSFMGLAIQAYEDGTLDEDETLTNLLSMLIAGHETTITLIGNGLKLLLESPAQMAALRKDRSLMRKAVEEFLRMEPGGNMILRVALKDVEIEGTVIPKGAMVIGLIGAVNRDEDRFKCPHDFDIARTANRQLTFGGGPHICIGAPLARLEADIAFSTLLNTFSKIELAGKPRWRLDRLNARGLSILPIRVEE